MSTLSTRQFEHVEEITVTAHAAGVRLGFRGGNEEIDVVFLKTDLEANNSVFAAEILAACHSASLRRHIEPVS